MVEKEEQSLVQILCSSRKYPYSPNRRDWNFLGAGGGGSVRPKNLKNCMKLNWNFQRGGGRYGYFLELHIGLFMS